MNGTFMFDLYDWCSHNGLASAHMQETVTFGELYRLARDIVDSTSDQCSTATIDGVDYDADWIEGKYAIKLFMEMLERRHEEESE